MPTRWDFICTAHYKPLPDSILCIPQFLQCEEDLFSLALCIAVEYDDSNSSAMLFSLFKVEADSSNIRPRVRISLMEEGKAIRRCSLDDGFAVLFEHS